MPLLLGGLIIALIIFVIVFPQKVTKINPYIIEGIKISAQKNGTPSIKGAPFPPSSENVLGTDSLGRDTLSLIIYGTRLTMELGGLVVLGRFIIAMPVGIAAGFGNSACKSAIDIFSILFSAIPALVISILILKISFFQGLFKSQSIIAFVTVLTVVGWARVAGVIKERTQDILSKPFINGEKAIGKSGLRITLENVMPHLSPEIVVLLFMEMALALSMIMELGFFGVYVGNLKMVADTSDAGMQVMNVSYEPEWASMLSTSINYLKTAPWTVLPPAVMFFVSIFGFNLFGEGIRDTIQNKDSKFIVYMRKALSVRIFTGKFLKAAGSVLAVLIVIIAVKGAFTYSNGQALSKQVLRIMDWKFKEQVLPGSKEAEYTAEKLGASLEQAGFKPIGQSFIQYYNIDKLYSVEKSAFSVKNGSNEKELIFGKDYSLSAYRNCSTSGQVINAGSIDMFNIKDYGMFAGKFVIFDEDIYSRKTILEFSKNLKEKSKALGVIDIINAEDELPSVASTDSMGSMIIYVTKDAGRVLKENSKLDINIKSSSLSGKGRNVIGILPGNDPKLSKEAIMLSMGYNYMDYNREAAEKKMKMMLEIAKGLQTGSKKLGRSIIIAFWDGNLTDEYAGTRSYVDNPSYLLANTAINIDITNMDISGDTLAVNSQQVPITKYFAWAFNNELQTSLKRGEINIQKNINKTDVKTILDQGPNSEQIMYYKGAVPTVLILPEQGNATAKKNKIDHSFADKMISTILNNRY